MTAGNGLAAQFLLWVNLHFKAQFLSQLGQHIHIASGFVTEAEVVAFVHFTGVQFLFQDALSELARRHEREIATEG